MSSETLKAELADDSVAARALERAARMIGTIGQSNVLIFTHDLAKTRSGQVMRRLVCDVAHGQQLGDVTTLTNAKVVDQIRKMAPARAGKEESTVPAGLVQTVLGPVRPEDLGLTLPHEHLLVRIEGWTIPPRNEEEARFAEAPMSPDLLVRVRRRALSNRDNCRIDDLGAVLAEVRAFAEAGGGTLVDVTTPDLGRNVEAMLELTRATGVHIVAGCGYYVDASHPPELQDMSSEAVAEVLEAELTEGIRGTAVRAGVIGEIGTGHPVTPRERKVLKGAVLAHLRTGAPISVHLFPAGGTAREVLDLLQELGADLNQVALGHLDGQDPIPVDEHIELASRGAYVEYDLFGANWTNDDLRDLYTGQLYWSPPPSDQQRVRALAALIEAGLGHRILISHDVCTKIQQAAWGGPGFVHIPKYMVPFFLANGLTREDVDTLVRRNPQRWLTWAEPRT